jgi:hypothetical protein
MIDIMKLVVSLFVVAATSFHAKGGAPINFVGFKNPSAPIFSKTGPTIINYELYDEYTGIHKPGAGLTEQGFVVIVIRDSNNKSLYEYFVAPPSGAFGNDINPGVPFRMATGNFQFSNPANQNLIIEERIWYTRPLENLAGFPSEEWSSASGRSLVSGGDKPPLVVPPPVGTPTPAPATRSSIHAVIISGRSDPTKVVTSANVTLTGGVIALGKDPSPPAKPTAQWSSGLRIIPDESLLTGAKIPPLTPNIIDVRIVKHEVTGDLSKPTE